MTALAWTAVNADGTADAYVSVSHMGTTFGPHVRVNDVAGEVRPSEQQAPRVAIRGDVVAVVWTARRQGATEIRLATSTDHGQTFGASQLISPVGAPGTRGWASLIVDEQHRVHVVWLDTRVAAAAAAATSPAARAGGATAAVAAGTNAAAGVTHAHAGMSSTRQDVYAATVSPDGAISEQRVATDVCFCCKTAIVSSGPSRFAAWRDIYPEGRDISFVKLGSTSEASRVRVSHDDWKIDACPEDGPAMTSTTLGAIQIVWPTLVSGADTKGVFFAETSDGEHFSPRVRLDAGPASASHPALAASVAGVLAAVWETSTGAGHRIEMRARHSGSWNATVALTDDGSVASPSIAALGSDFVVAWSRKDGAASRIEVQRIDARR